MARRVQYSTIIDGIKRDHPSLEAAIRHWDGQTHGRLPAPLSGIIVQEWDGEYMVRDGSILCVSKSGSVYLNPTVGSEGVR